MKAYDSTTLYEVDPAAIRKSLDRQFKAAEALLDLAWACRPTSRVKDDAGTVIVAIFARSTFTYRAVLRLCAHGYAPQADMLCRTLFEDMATAHWASLPTRRGEVMRKLADQEDHNRLLMNDVANKHEWLDETAQDLTELEERRKELDNLFGRYGDKPWPGLSLYRLVEEIEELWESETGKRDLWSFYDVAHRLNNQTVHTTAVAIARAAERGVDHDGSESVFFKAGPYADEEALGRSLAGAYWTYGQLVSLILQEQGLEMDEFIQVFNGGGFAFGNMEGVGRNDPCPCGSGMKFKRCHGA